MSSDPDATINTMATLKPLTLSEGGATIFALTIVAHGDPTKVGARAYLPHIARKEQPLSRLEPVFSIPGEAGVVVVADPHVSRKPLTLRETKDGVVIDATGTSTKVFVNGTRVDEAVTVPMATVENGVCIELGRHVVVLLHRHGEEQVANKHALVGESTAVMKLRQEIDRVADALVPILIVGETGTGKEKVARALHDASPRRDGPFIAVNMATLPTTMAASQLFGHKRGAFSGADRDYEGLFEQADGGTLFLDEIGETPAEVQPMLLRVLEDAVVQPLGSGTSRAVDVRVIAATDLDLQAAVDGGEFRAPLLHRLAGYQIATPPLRERRDDIGRLLYHFLGEELEKLGDGDDPLTQTDPQKPMWLPTPLVVRLMLHDWPGNVRELRNISRRLALLGRGREMIKIDDSLASMLPMPDKASIEVVLPRTKSSAELSDDDLVTALAANKWKTSATARALGISKATLYQLMDKCPLVRTAKELEADEIREWQEKTGGNTTEMANGLKVSERGLKLRMTELGL